MEKEREVVSNSKQKDESNSSSSSTPDPTFHKVADLAEVGEGAAYQGKPRHQNHAVEVPTAVLKDTADDFVRINLTQTPSPATIGVARRAQRLPHTPRTFSPTWPFTPRSNKISSLPVTPTAHLNPESRHGEFLNLQKGGAGLPIHCSHSVPVLNKDVSQCDSLTGLFRVIPATPRTAAGVATTANTSTESDSDGNDVGGENVPEEKAVCRICLVEIGEGAGSLKMECSCKGELALAHQECAIKWFSIKGNKTCDVCKHEVQNLPVTLFRVQNGESISSEGNLQIEAAQYRGWQDVPILVTVSMLAYFSFLEQLLVLKMKSRAVAISLPFSFTLGLLASMTTTRMVGRNYIWIYAFVQFALVVLSGHLFYSLLQLDAVLSVLLSAFSGFGLMMCGTSILYEVSALRRRRWQLQHARSQSSQQLGTREVTPLDQPTTVVSETLVDQHRSETESESINPERVSGG